MIKLSNQVALVTGGSRGIGAATAIMLAQAGADVAIMFKKNRRAAKRVIERITAIGRRSSALQGDLGEHDSCKKVVSGVVKEFGRIDILVNCGGIWENAPISTITPNQWRKTLNVNLDGSFSMCRLVVPVMINQGYGRIINMASTAGQRGEPSHSHYAASKGAIIAFTKSIAVELIKHNIWVNCVAPGWVSTDMTSRVEGDRRELRGILANIPRGRFATPEEIAGPVLFLASSLSDHIVGEIMNVNGGSILCG